MAAAIGAMTMGCGVVVAISMPGVAMAATDGVESVTPISLDAALTRAEDANIDLIRARLAVKTSQANLRSANTAPNPVLSVDAVQIRPSQVGSLSYPNLVDTVARIDLPLERGGKRTARTREASALVDAAQDDMLSAHRDMREAVFGAYYDLKAAEERRDILQAIARGYAEGMKMANLQRHAGALSDGDLAKQNVEASRAGADAMQAVTQWHVAQLALAGLIGAEAQAGQLATSGDWPVRDAGKDAAPDLIALRRPDVLAAQARVEAARRALDGAHALRHPDVTVGVQYERADGDLGVGNSVGVGVSIPLPVRNRYNGEVDAAGVALVQAEAEARKAVAMATADIVIARQALDEATQRRLQFDDEQLTAARKANDIAEFAYKNGATSLIELLDARRSLRAIELGAVDARSDQANALARLKAAETTGDDQ